MGKVEHGASRVECVIGGEDWSAPERAQAVRGPIFAPRRDEAEDLRARVARVGAAMQQSVRPLFDDLKRQRARGAYDARKLPCDERVEAALTSLACEAESFVLSGAAWVVDAMLLPVFSNTLLLYACSRSWPFAESWQVAAMAHMYRLSAVRDELAGWRTEDWTARARRVADVVGPLRAQIVMSYGHPGERVSMGKKRTRGHRLAAFLSDEEWPKVRSALGIDRSSTPAYEVERITVGAREGTAASVARFADVLADPSISAAYGLGVEPTEAERVRVATWLASALGMSSSHGSPIATARALIAEGWGSNRAIAALSGANERAVRGLLKGK